MFPENQWMSLLKVAELGIKSFENIDIGEFKPTKGKNVAIIGGGVSGLSTAWNLMRLGYSIEIFEKMLKSAEN